ncbi:MAG: 30S ribosomal protein S8 [Bdellovibrionales bacterium]|jgi:small subunit ribosomal protein S8|nr:30S ribosomal protein S8 [Bdellovibrionales bacterium]
MDTIGDFLTRVRNAGMAKHEKVDIPASNVRKGIAQVLQDYGYIRSFKVARDGKQGVMRVYLKYNEKGTPAITNVQRVSRPSRRIYTKSDSIPSIRNGFGISIMSTNKGIMSGDAAKEQKVGGEILCKIW